MTSLIDVVLLLLVFFMISTSFVHETNINLRLPQADESSAPSSEANALEITISQAGNYTVNGRPLVNRQKRTLREAIKRLTAGKRDMPVVIRADALATHQSVVTAMDVAGELGFVKIGIATVHTPDQ